jgi:general secretion pathway protein D
MRPFPTTILAALLALLCLTPACAQLQPIAPAAEPPAAQPMAQPMAQPIAQPTVPPAAQPAAQPDAQSAAQPRIIRGNDQVLAPANQTGQIKGKSAGLKFEDTPLADVLSLVLREIAQVDYVVYPPISGTVTLATQGQVTADQAVFLLEAALQANGMLMVRDARGTYHIGRAEAIKGAVPALRQSGRGPLPPGYGAIVVPLKYMGAGEMASILRPMAPADAIVRVDTVRNLLVLVGTRTQAEGWLDIINTFDVDLLKGMSVGVFPLKYVTIAEVDAALRLLGGASASAPAAAQGSANAAASVGRPAAAAGADAASLPGNFPLFGALRVIPIERINSVLIITPRAAYLDEARRWLEKLDQPGGNSAEAQLFVFAVQNGSAKHLANVLNGLFGGDVSASSSAAPRSVAPGLPTSTANTSGFGSSASSSAGAGAGALSGGTSTVQGSGLTTVKLSSGVRVMADEINNAVLVYGTRGEYEKIQATLKQLDVSPTQVLIEASIIEVSLNDDLKYGLQWIFSDTARGSSDLTGTGVLSNIAGAALSPVGAGFSYTLRNAAGNVRAVLSALAEKSLVKVISSPTLMVLDNHSASIAVGNQQPIKVGESITEGGLSQTNIQYKDTGVTLTVTPSVNAGNMVTMQVAQGVTDVGQIDVATGQRSFLQRQFASKLAVRSGESVVLGGLIRDNTTTGKSGVPGLHDIPLFGHLFGATTTNTNRVELVVIITPRVVRNEQDTREVGQELKDRMKVLFPPPESLPAQAPEGGR